MMSSTDLPDENERNPDSWIIVITLGSGGVGSVRQGIFGATRLIEDTIGFLLALILILISFTGRAAPATATNTLGSAISNLNEMTSSAPTSGEWRSAYGAVLTAKWCRPGHS